MKKILTTALALAIAVPAFAGPVRISQVYGGSGNLPGSTYRQDYIELHNFSPNPVSVAGWSIYVAPATGNFGTNRYDIPALIPGTSNPPTVPACGYLLIAVGATSASGAAYPVAADLSTTNANLSGTNGKIALISGGNAGTGICPTGNVEDVVTYGVATSCEGSPAPALSTTTALVRKLGGVEDSNDNSVDFEVVSDPQPRNRTSPLNTNCLVTPTQNSSWGSIKTLYR
jgi:hypothetical protein